MSPSAIPMDGTTTTSSLLAAGITANLSKTAVSTLNGVSTFTHNAATPLPELDASLLKTTLTTSPRPVPSPSSPAYAEMKTCTDHMITASWTLAHGWAAPELKPYGPLSLMPTASCLHYATECFEGLKLYRGHDGALRLFRPNLNCNRMLTSATRIALPGFPPDELLKLIAALAKADGPRWLPRSRPGNFLYIRPTLIADDPALGVRRPRQALLYIILSCFPALDAAAQAHGGMRLLASRDDMVRAWPGGFGFAKVGANYGPSLAAQGEAQKRGFDQILWLFGPDGRVTEAGASNFFVVLRGKEEGRCELLTAPLSERIILDGVTRRSVLDLARDRFSTLSSSSSSGTDLMPLDVTERTFTMQELEAAAREGRLVEAFAAGTAFFIAPVSLIHFRGEDIGVPLPGEKRGASYALTFKRWLRDIMYGAGEEMGNPWGWVVDDDDEGEAEEQRVPE